MYWLHYKLCSLSKWKFLLGFFYPWPSLTSPQQAALRKPPPPGLRQGQQKPPDDVLLEQDGCNPHQSPASFPLSFAGLTSATRWSHVCNKGRLICLHRYDGSSTPWRLDLILANDSTYASWFFFFFFFFSLHKLRQVQRFFSSGQLTHVAKSNRLQTERDSVPTKTLYLSRTITSAANRQQAHVRALSAGAARCRSGCNHIRNAPRDNDNIMSCSHIG